MRLFRATRLLLPTTLCGSLVACGGPNPTGSGTPPPTTPVVVSVAIVTPPPATLEVGSRIQLRAEARDGAGMVLTSQPFAWASDRPAVATVTRSGQVTAMAEGQATITVSVGDRSASVALTVTTPAVQTIGIFPATLGLAPGEHGQFSASAIGSNGTIPGAVIAWGTSNQDVATVDATGRVTGVGPGIAEIRARVGLVVRSRGVTVSNETRNFWIHRADFIQIAQNAAADVPLVRGKPSAVRLFPAANVTDFTDLPIDVQLERGGSVIFSTRVSSGPIPTTPSISDGAQGIMVPLPPLLDIEGATLRVTIDPDNQLAERDEWDNMSPIHGDDAAPIVMQSVPALRIRLVPIAPVGNAPPAISAGSIATLAGFMRTIYPTASVEVTLRPATLVTSYPWPDRDALVDVLSDLEVERLADGFNGHYYGVQQVGAISGIVGIGWLSGRTALGTANDVVFAHEIGHNLGLGHPPGCGADQANTGYPYQNGQIGLRGFDPRSGLAVPATSIDMMGYCPGFKWVSGGYFRGMLSELQKRGGSTLRTAPADAVPSR